MSFSRLAVPAVLVTAGLGFVALGQSGPVRAQQTPPTARVFGSIQVNGANAHSGAVVTAFGGSTACGTASGNGLYNGTQYFVDIDSSQAACSTPGNTLSFKVDGASANETLQVPNIPGSAIQLNLTVTGGGAPTGTSSQVTYGTGWNLVGGPTGQMFAQALNPLYTFGPGATDYTSVPNTQAITGGVGYWAYFNSSTTVTISGSATLPANVTVPAGQYIMIGNPSPTATVTVSGADVVYTYDPVNGYQSASQLKPGQGAWVFSNAGGQVTMR